MKSFQIIVNGKVDIFTNVFESQDSQRVAVVTFNPKNKDTYFLFCDFEKLLERDIKCYNNFFFDSEWKIFNGQRIPKENLCPLVTTQTKLLDPVLNWINGDINDIYLK
jgi:hypothetical protein